VFNALSFLPVLPPDGEFGIKGGNWLSVGIQVRYGMRGVKRTKSKLIPNSLKKRLRGSNRRQCRVVRVLGKKGAWRHAEGLVTGSKNEKPG
jgi:hypothetical protein